MLVELTQLYTMFSERILVRVEVTLGDSGTHGYVVLSAVLSSGAKILLQPCPLRGMLEGSGAVAMAARRHGS